MTSTLRNFGGVDFTNLSTTIESSDPYITISDNAGYFGYLAVDSTAENTGDPYVISADASTPNGHVADIQLIAADGAFADTFEVSITIGTYHYLVWNPDPTPISGQRIDSILTDLGYAGMHSTVLLGSDPIDMYEAIFVCVGIFSYNHIIGASSPEAFALVDYMNSGGNVYLEGGDVWYYDPPSGYNFGPLFGIQPVGDGSGDLYSVAGIPTTFTEGMGMSYSGENSYIDHLSATGNGFSILKNATNTDTVGVANDAGTYKTVGTSFELGGLVDGSGVSTKAALLDSIMHFFGINVTGVEEITELGAKKTALSIAPNPFGTFTDIRYQITDNSHNARLRIYDISGRLVRDLSTHLSDIGHQSSVIWNGTDERGRRLPAGIYFVRLNTEDYAETQKIILVE